MIHPHEGDVADRGEPLHALCARAGTNPSALMPFGDAVYGCAVCHVDGLVRIKPFFVRRSCDYGGAHAVMIIRAVRVPTVPIEKVVTSSAINRCLASRKPPVTTPICL